MDPSGEVGAAVVAALDSFDELMLGPGPLTVATPRDVAAQPVSTVRAPVSASVMSLVCIARNSFSPTCRIPGYRRPTLPEWAQRHRCSGNDPET